MRLLVETGLPLMGGIIGSGGEVSWPRPTRPGDTLTVVSEIEEITPSRSRPDRGMIRVRSGREISTARSCRFSWRSSSCRDARPLRLRSDVEENGDVRSHGRLQIFYVRAGGRCLL